MVEFALLAPVFIFMMIGVIEVSRYMYFGIVAAHAARAGRSVCVRRPRRRPPTRA